MPLPGYKNDGGSDGSGLGANAERTISPVRNLDTVSFINSQQINQNNVAEGNSLPGLQQGNYRVPSPSGFKVLGTPIFNLNGNTFTLVWDNIESAQQITIDKYNVYVQYNYAQQTAPVLVGSSSGSPCVVKVVAQDVTNVTFFLQPELSNGLKLPLEACPTCTGVTALPEYIFGPFTDGSFTINVEIVEDAYQGITSGAIVYGPGFQVTRTLTSSGNIRSYVSMTGGNIWLANTSDDSHWVQVDIASSGITQTFHTIGSATVYNGFLFGVREANFYDGFDSDANENIRLDWQSPTLWLRSDNGEGIKFAKGANAVISVNTPYASLTNVSDTTFKLLTTLALNLTATGNFTLNQNSVAVVTSEAASASANTLYLKQGKAGVGTTNPSAAIHTVVSGSATSALFTNASQGVRILSNGTSNILEGVDNTGVGSYQPLVVGGSTVQLSISGTLKVTLDTGGRLGIGTTSPNSSSILDLTSTAGALLIPRMTTTQKNALTATNGMIVYDTTLGKFQGYEAGAWTSFI